jgi:hypothetical protein
MTEGPLPVLLYDAGQAALILHCKPEWLKRQAREGKIPAKRMGRLYVWTPAQIKQIIDGLKESKPAAVPRSRAKAVPQEPEEPELRAQPPRNKRSAA